MKTQDGGAYEELADDLAGVTLSAPVCLTKAFRNVERYTLELKVPSGGAVIQTRDVMRVGRIVGVLPVDLDRNELVLIRQFRLPAHLATGRGDLVEIVAGYVKAQEELDAAARRECLEELGVTPNRIVKLFSFMPSPGVADEYTTMFLASVDASQVPKHAGAANETEQTHPIRISIDTALTSLAQGMTCNGYLIIALQWLALNRVNLERLLRPDEPDG